MRVDAGLCGSDVSSSQTDTVWPRGSYSTSPGLSVPILPILLFVVPLAGAGGSGSAPPTPGLTFTRPRAFLASQALR